MVPAVESTLRGPRKSVVSAVSALGRAAFESPAVSEMTPPGVSMRPSTATVRPVRLTVASGSVRMMEPSPMNRSPRSNGTS